MRLMIFLNCGVYNEKSKILQRSSHSSTENILSMIVN